MCASSQSEHSLRRLLEEALHDWLSKLGPVKILIRQCEWNVQDDLNLGWAHITEGVISDIAAHPTHIREIPLTLSTEGLLIFHYQEDDLSAFRKKKKESRL